MRSPIRDQIKLDGRWQARPIDEHTASVFVPGPWAEKRVALTPAEGETWTSVQVEGKETEEIRAEGAWLAGPHINPGQWNTISVTDGNLAGAQLVASEHLHFTFLEATRASDRRLAIRVRLSSGSQEGRPAEPPPELPLRFMSMFTIVLTLTSAAGKQVGGMEVTVGRKTRDLTVEMALPEPLSGAYRLKACLTANEHIIDNARTDLSL